ncbi:hypothetical protein PARHAE_01088 [Paracoccus haematequi]|uniref:Uncharacterized protein n=1 Tax=Paracoccus haematequi TaxID=2491866 RepID=A0A447IK87_9RHOB|nr:hypothetical protein [Paracoccus haematequi]VDS07908.1 hypothetical protein PARHAE_01088 [Paracoccus haematequi]
MFMRNLGHVTRYFSAEGADGGAGGDGGAAADAAAAAAAAGAEAGAGDGGAKWFEDARIPEDARTWMTAKGVTAAADPSEAILKMVGMGQAADRRFGRPIDQVIDKPGKDQSLAEWRRAHADAFDLPADASGYEITRPEGLTDDIAWNDDLAGKFREKAFELGLSPQDAQEVANMYAGHIAELNGSIERDMREAEAKLSAELDREWGKDAEVKTTRARQAAAALAEQAGLDAEGIKAVVGLLSSGAPGQTLAIKMFAALGEGMAEDKGIGLRAGASGFGMSKEEATAEFNKFMAPDGEWAKASAARDSEAIARLRPQFDRLAKMAAGAK